MEINKIYCESNLETMARMEDKSIDYVLTSPPYNIGYNNMNGNSSKKYKEFDDNFSDDDYFEQQVYLIEELLRVTKNHVFYNIQMLGGNKLSFLKLIGNFSSRIKDIMIWEKKMIPHIESGVLSSNFEFIIIFSDNLPDKKKFYDGNFKGNFSNLIKTSNKHHNEFSEKHKAIMPLDIPRMFMVKFGKPNDIWYDPYSGTGTTAVAAILEQRQYLGSEISNEYYDLSLKRISQHQSQTRLF